MGVFGSKRNGWMVTGLALMICLGSSGMVSAAKGKYKSLERLNAGLKSVRFVKLSAQSKLAAVEKEIAALSQQKSYVKVYTAEPTSVEINGKARPEVRQLANQVLVPTPPNVASLKRRLHAQLSEGNIVVLSEVLLGEREILSSGDVTDAIEGIRSVEDFKNLIGARVTVKPAIPTEVAAEPEEADRDRLQELADQAKFLEMKIAKCVRDEKHIRAEIKVVQNLGDDAIEPAKPKTNALRRPVDARITSQFGMRMHPVLKEERMHKGLDFGAPYGTPVEAASQGKVKFAGQMNGYGGIVILEHRPGFETAYAHLSKIEVTAGEYVGRGFKIGEVGTSGLSTGPHLHFEIRINGAQVDPIDYL